MFPRAYFPARYFTPRYFPIGGGSTPIPDATRFGDWMRPVHGGIWTRPERTQEWLNQSVRSSTWTI